MKRHNGGIAMIRVGIAAIAATFLILLDGSPSMVVVAPGEPGVPVVCCADAGEPSSRNRKAAAIAAMPTLIIAIPPL